MEISIVTLFPEVLPPLLTSSILGRAQRKKLVRIHFYNPRDYAKDKYKTVDDKPYGGGVGMLMRVDVVEQAVQEAIEGNNPLLRRLSPKARMVLAG